MPLFSYSCLIQTPYVKADRPKLRDRVPKSEQLRMEETQNRLDQGKEVDSTGSLFYHETSIVTR